MDINALLRKKSWSGKELGILEITNMCYKFKQGSAGLDNPLIDDQTFSIMLEKNIKTKEDAREYSEYMDIHKFISLVHNVKHSSIQQLQLRHKIILDYIQNAIHAEDIYYYIDELPVIMTEKQYKEEREKRLQKIIANITYTPMEILLILLNKYIDSYKKNPRKANPLKQLFKKYAIELIKSKHTLRRYNEKTDNGYYTLPDGRRSDQMSEEEWNSIIKAEEEKIKRKINKSSEDIKQKRFIRKVKAVYNGMTPHEADKTIKEQDGLVVKTEWHIYEEPPKDLTKWEVLANNDFIYELYNPKKSDDIKAFIEDYEELAELLKDEIDRLYFKGFSKIPYDEYHKEHYSGKEAYNNNFASIDYITEDSYIFDGERANRNGIAILQPNWLNRCIDKNGYYKEPKIIHSLQSYSLEAFFPGNENYDHNIKTIKTSRKSILVSYYFLSCIDYIIKATADLYDIPDIKIFGVDMNDIKEMIDALNDTIAVLYTRICDTLYQDETIKERKLQVIKDIFYPIDYEQIKIPTEKIDELIQYTRNFNNMINILLTMYEETKEGANNE